VNDDNSPEKTRPQRQKDPDRRLSSSIKIINTFLFHGIEKHTRMMAQSLLESPA
jgi:hypothetical protein